MNFTFRDHKTNETIQMQAAHRTHAMRQLTAQRLQAFETANPTKAVTKVETVADEAGRWELVSYSPTLYQTTEVGFRFRISFKTINRAVQKNYEKGEFPSDHFPGMKG